MSGRFLRFLTWLYFPFLILICVLSALGAVTVARVWFSYPGIVGVACLFVGVFLGVTVVHVLVGCSALLSRPSMDDGMEIHLPTQWQQGLIEFVDKVAEKCKLPSPDEIRLHAQTVAHVYEDDRDSKILVFGGIALATLSRRGLAAVIAHELSHFAAGDTRLVRAGFRRHQAMSYLETRFTAWPGFMFNPLVWFLRLYHQLYQVIWSANSRATEFAADQHTVRLVGAESTAATLLLLEVPEMFPWARVSSIAQECVSLGIPMTDVFTEQVSRAQGLSRQDWQDACLKALRRETRLLDSHPALKDRLRRVGVDPRTALPTAIKTIQTGPAARELFENWQLIEELLTKRVVEVYRSIYQAKREAAQIYLGRPL